MTREIIALLNYAKTAHPIIQVSIVLFIVFGLFGIARKYFRTDYITISKESREEQKQVYDNIRQDYERVMIKNERLELKIINLEKEIQKLKQLLNVATNNDPS